MKRIPVKIVEFSHDGNIIQEIMIDLTDMMQLKGNYEEKIECFRNRYFELVKKAQNYFMGEDQNKKKKYQTLPSSAYYNIGKLLQKFNDEVKNEFKIINYTEALSRDFGLSVDYHHDISTIVKIFKKEQILDSVPFSYYRALKRKKTDLDLINLFDNEIKRLNMMGKENKLPGREKYKIGLIDIIKKHQNKIS